MCMYLCVYTYVCVYCYKPGKLLASLKMLHLRGKRKNTKRPSDTLGSLQE